MEKAIRDLVQIAEQRRDIELAETAKAMLDTLAMTANAPSNWREIPSKIARDYANSKWLTETLRLWEYEEVS